MPPNPFRPVQAPAVPANPLQTNPFRTLPQARPNSLPPLPQPNHRHLPGQTNAIPLPVPLPPQLQQQFAQAMAQQGEHNNEQTPDSTSQQPGQDTQRPGDAAPGPLPGAPPLPSLGLPNLPGNGDQPLRREGVGPNGARWTVTYNQLHIPAHIRQPPAAFGHPHPLAFGRPSVPPGVIPSMGHDGTQRLLPRIQTIFQETQREMDNVRTLLQPVREPGTTSDRLSTSNTSSLNLPVWRVDHIRQHLSTINQNLNVVERALALLPTEPEVVALRRSVTEIRVDALELNIILDRQQGGSPNRSSIQATDMNLPILGPTSSTIPGPPVMTPAVPPASQPHTQSARQTIPADAPTELFLLSSPQGPVGLLFDQQGTYTTAPMISTLPFQSFSAQFAQNRQTLAGLGQQMAQGRQLHNQLANMQPTPTQQPEAGGRAHDQNQAQNQVQNHNQNQNANANPNANQPEENDRMINVAGHMWLIFKLAAFVYFFSGGGGLYRPIMLGIVAAIVYLAQAGMFQEQINMARRHFEALLPVGALAERVAQPNTQRQTQQRGNLSPEEAARRILQQRRDQRFGWIRDSMRAIERAFALFVASLFPGVGERMVHAQEERERLERVAAREERERQEEETRRRAEEAQAERERTEEKKADGDLTTQDESNASASNKGKERAATAEDEAAGPSS